MCADLMKQANLEDYRLLMYCTACLRPVHPLSGIDPEWQFSKHAGDPEIPASEYPTTGFFGHRRQHFDTYTLGGLHIIRLATSESYAFCVLGKVT